MRFYLWFIIFTMGPYYINGFSAGISVLTGLVCATLIEAMIWYNVWE